MEKSLLRQRDQFHAYSNVPLNDANYGYRVNVLESRPPPIGSGYILRAFQLTGVLLLNPWGSGSGANE